MNHDTNVIGSPSKFPKFYAFLFSSVVILALGIPSYFIYRNLEDIKSESTANRKACETLDLKVFDAVKVKNDKFYADQIFYAKHKYAETIKVSYPYEDDKDKMLTFYCKDLEKAEEQ